ncbi:SDR family oxidoreductase [soil metagenome]
MKASILVTGATGYIGGRLAPRLIARGHDVHCLARNPESLRGRVWAEHATLHQGDVTKPETLAKPLAGIDTAYYLIHSLGGGDNYAERDLEAAGAFAREATKAGVKRVIYLGGIEPTGTPSEHLQSRLDTGEALRKDGPPLTEFRAAVIVGSGSASFELVRYLTERVPVMISPRWVRTRTQPIAVRDVLAYLIDALDLPETEGRVIEIGGPEVLTYGEMFKRYATARGLKRVVVPVPLLTPNLSSLWAGLVTPIPAAVARPLIKGLKSEVVVRDSSGMALFDIPRTPYDEAVRLALQRFNDDRTETAWHGALSSSRSGAKAEQLEPEKNGLMTDRRERIVNASAENVFKVATSIGGETGWLYANPLWRIRGAFDRLLGGPGLRRGRRSRADLHVGDAVDFWRVEALEPGRLLRLRAEMQLPGRAWLEFLVESEGPARSRLTQTAYYEPKGLLGLGYWYALMPVHPSIYKGMLSELARRAEERERNPAPLQKALPDD